MTSAARRPWPRRWAAGLAWTLWVSTMLGLAAELLEVVDQTMQPTRASPWLRPPNSVGGSAPGR